MKTFIQNGISYSYEYDENTGVLEVFDCEGKIASGQFCDQTEAFYYDYFNEETGKIDDHGGATTDIYHNNNPLEAAEWLAATHPEL